MKWEQRYTPAMQLVPMDFKFCLDSLRPRIGRYGWLWRALRTIGARSGRFPVDAHRALQHFGSAARPYFVARTSNDVLFIGDHRDPEAVALACDPTYGSAMLHFLEARLRRMNGPFLDIGCGIGVESAAIAKAVGSRVDVLAFEPNVRSARLAAATFALNGLSNVRLFPIAISDFDGELATHGTLTSMDSTPPPMPAKTVATNTTVLCRTLDGLMDSGAITRSALMRIHEGVDGVRALSGARRVLSNLRPTIVALTDSSEAPENDTDMWRICTVIDSAAPYNYKVVQSDADSKTLGLVGLNAAASNQAGYPLFCTPALG